MGWALLQFVWQGAAIGVLTALALVALRRSASDVRYVVAAIGLALMLTLPVVTGVQKFQALRAEAGADSRAALAARAAERAASVREARRTVGVAPPRSRRAPADRRGRRRVLAQAAVDPRRAAAADADPRLARRRRRCSACGC